VRRSLILIVGILLLGATAALAASGANRVVGNCRSSQVKPKSIILACADVNTYVNKIVWKSFGGASATARGALVENDCTPNCAAGHFHSYPVTFTLTHAEACFDRHDDYRLISITFIAARPPRTPAHTKEQLFCPVG
jgi:hypothetical protein